MLLSPSDLQILVRLEAGLTQSQIGNDLGLEQPAVSKAIRAAEKRLGMTLVHADGRRLKLTNLGREVARAGASVLTQVRAVDDLIVALRAGRTKHTRILASSMPGEYLLPQAIARFLQRDGDARIEVDIVPIASLWEEFSSGSYDLAVTARLPNAGHVRAQPLYLDPVVFFVAPGHRLAHAAPIALDELRDEQLVGRFSGPYWQRIHDELRERGCAFVRSIDLASAEAVKRIVGSGVGVGLLFGSALREERERGTLVVLPVADVAYAQSYYLVRPRHETTAQANAFCAFLREELALEPVE